MIRGANDPPLQADPAPTSPPVLYCGAVPMTPAPASSAATSLGTTTSPATTTSTTAPNGPTTSRPSAPTEDLPGCESMPTYGPQLRGAFDPDARMTELLSIVVPLITTIVAFFFGQHAGASQAQGAIKDKNAMEQAIRDHAGRKESAQTVMDLMTKQGVMR